MFFKSEGGCNVERPSCGLHIYAVGAQNGWYGMLSYDICRVLWASDFTVAVGKTVDTLQMCAVVSFSIYSIIIISMLKGVFSRRKDNLRSEGTCLFKVIRSGAKLQKKIVITDACHHRIYPPVCLIHTWDVRLKQLIIHVLCYKSVLCP